MIMLSHKHPHTILLFCIHSQSRGKFRIADDTQIITSFSPAGLHVLAMHIHMCDLFARGFSRTYCVCYCTVDEEKLYTHSQQIIKSMSMVSILLHYSNVKIFNEDLLLKIKSLQEKQLQLQSPDSQADEKVEKVLAEVETQTKRLVEVASATDAYLKAKERRQMFDRIDKESERKIRAMSMHKPGYSLQFLFCACI
eukprot:m.50409 g.50409  ORF g.50409 m.50409 type:complete len:196 (+) comp10882_c1_seq5:125-712(+)